MKANFRISSTISFILVGMAILSCTTQPPIEQEEKKSLEGAWELIYSEYVYTAVNDTLIGAEFEYPPVKLLTKNHVAFGRRKPNDESISAGGGKYSYDGETYTFHIKYHTHTPAVGTKVEFKSKLEGDKWTIKGVIPGVDGDILLKEIWKRIE